jgi:AraC-like DNA-binding protein
MDEAGRQGGAATDGRLPMAGAPGVTVGAAQTAESYRALLERRFGRGASIESPRDARIAYAIYDFGAGDFLLASRSCSEHSVRIPEDDVVIASLPIRGAHLLRSRGGDALAREGDLLVKAWESRGATFYGSYSGLAMVASARRLRERAEARLERTLPDRLRPTTLAPAARARRFALMLRRAIETIERGTLAPGAPRAAALRRLLEEELSDALLDTAFARPGLPLDAEPRRAAPDPVIDRAVDHIAAHFAEPLTMSDVAAASGAGVRSLQYGFARRFAASPWAFVRAFRLDAARRMLSAEAAASVTDAALAVGYNHLGQFASDYRARFGESPSHTLRRRP